MERNHCFPIFVPYSAPRRQRGWISRLDVHATVGSSAEQAREGTKKEGIVEFECGEETFYTENMAGSTAIRSI
jgi:hypothetical protein